jgi:hypothetical protein
MGGGFLGSAPMRPSPQASSRRLTLPSGQSLEDPPVTFKRISLVDLISEENYKHRSSPQSSNVTRSPFFALG